MATISISGTNKLAERIVLEAQAEAQATLEESGAAVREIQSQGEKAVAAKRTELITKREAEKTGILGGYQTRAALDGRKAALAKKRAVIDRAFSGAYQAILSLSADKRGQICERMLRTETEGGETIVPAANDRKAIEQVLASMPERKLKLSDENASLDGGFLILAKGYEKDCSFRSLLNQVRSEEETNVYKLLFD
jgi:vacuolar-type H+-ATPase subunit E/Vma4